MKSYCASVILEKTGIREGGDSSCPQGVEGLQMGEGWLKLWTPEGRTRVEGQELKGGMVRLKQSRLSSPAVSPM